MVRLVNNNQTLVDLTNATRKDSREAYRVYLNKFDAYKLFTSREQAEQASRTILAAKAAGLPIARESKPYYQAVLEEDGTQALRVFVLQSERHIGEFFQLSKPGHVQRLARAIKASQPENRRKAIRAFQAAQEFKLTDPQGFFDLTLGMPIRFFDVHVGQAAPQLQEIIELLE